MYSGKFVLDLGNTGEADKLAANVNVPNQSLDIILFYIPFSLINSFQHHEVRI